MVRRDKAKFRRTESSTTASVPYSALSPYQPHDKFVKCAFNNKEIAIDFFAAHLDLNPEELTDFFLGPTEFQRAHLSKQVGDVMYQGNIEEQTYYIEIEHQSRDDKKMPIRTLRYHMALVNMHIEQGGNEIPITIILCLYHDPNKNKKWESEIILDSCFINEKHANRSFLGGGINPFKLIDLTIVSDEEISEHGKASIVEWALRDAYLPGDEYLRQMAKRIDQQSYLGLEDSFKDALIEYMAYVCKGSESLHNVMEVVNKLINLIPGLPEEEKARMETIGERFREQLVHERQEGIQQGMQQGKLEELKSLLKLIQSESYDSEKLSHILIDEINRISANMSESTPSSQVQEAAPGLDRLTQGIVSTAKQEAGGAIGSTSPRGRHELGELTQTPDRRKRT
jgi:predicted transposase YdaD